MEADHRSDHQRIRSYLSFNLRRGKHEGHFTWRQIAEQVRNEIPQQGISIEALMQALKNVSARDQVRWKYSRQLASAWGVRELVLLHTDWSKHRRREALKKATGFDVEAIVRRWENRNRRPGADLVTLNYDRWMVAISRRLSKHPNQPDESRKRWPRDHGDGRT